MCHLDVGAAARRGRDAGERARFRAVPQGCAAWLKVFAAAPLRVILLLRAGVRHGRSPMPGQTALLNGPQCVSEIGRSREPIGDGSRLGGRGFSVALAHRTAPPPVGCRLRRPLGESSQASCRPNGVRSRKVQTLPSDSTPRPSIPSGTRHLGVPRSRQGHCR
jgi:hypothetical protein